MQPIRTRAMLLRRVDTGEADRVVTLLTENLGKVSAIARGARRSRKRFGAALALFVLAEAELQPRRGSGLYALTAYDALAQHAGISQDLAAIAHGSYATEVIAELCPQDQPEPPLFELLLEMYQYLQTDKPSSEALRIFELRALRGAGLLPQLTVCARCGAPMAAAPHKIGFDEGRGGVTCGECTSPDHLIHPTSFAALGRLAESPLARARDLALEEPARTELRRLLSRYITYVVGKPLKAVEFIRKVSR